MNGARELAKHFPGMGGVPRFSKDLRAQSDDRIRRQNDVRWKSIGDHRALGHRQPLREIGGRKRRMIFLIDVGRLDDKIEPCLFQQLSSPWRSAGENEPARSRGAIRRRCGHLFNSLGLWAGVWVLVTGSVAGFFSSGPGPAVGLGTFSLLLF